MSTLKSLLLLSFLLTCGFTYSQESANFGAAKFAPQDGDKLLIMGQDLGAVGGLNNYTDGYVDNITGHTPAGVTSYTSLSTLGGLTNLDNWGSGDVRAQSYLEDETFDNSFIVIGLYLVNQLTGIVNGTYDNSLTTFANWIKSQNRPVFIRIGYEFEGPWNSYNPTQFKAAWQYIVHKFDDLGVKNAAYVWQSAGLNYSNIIDWYPGDEYVNWVGYSQFDGNNMGQSITTFAEEHDKPIMIAEATPRVDLKVGSGEPYWANWYEPLLQTIYDNNRIKALAYINVNWDSQSMWQGQGWGDSRIHVNAFVKENWEGEMEKECWLMGNDDLLTSINYQSWIATSTDDLSNEENDLLVSFEDSLLLVQSKNGDVLEDVQIADFTGRILYQDSKKTSIFKINTNSFSAKRIVVSVLSNNRRIAQKIILHSSF